MNRKITIAIDGYSSCGKSTIAKSIAQNLNYIYVDSGAMYRAVSLYLLNEGIIKDQNFLQSQIVSALPAINISFETAEDGKNMTFLNGKNVEEEIRKPLVSSIVSQISTISNVRDKLVKIQQEMGRNGGVVMDGRDIGTVVFPNAELKIFMTANIDIRAERRLKELLSKGEKISLNEVKMNLQQRDHIDQNREISPLTKAPDAVIIDNSTLSLDEQLHEVMILVKKRLHQLQDN